MGVSDSGLLSAALSSLNLDDWPLHPNALFAHKGYRQSYELAEKVDSRNTAAIDWWKHYLDLFLLWTTPSIGVDSEADCSSVFSTPDLSLKYLDSSGKKHTFAIFQIHPKSLDGDVKVVEKQLHKNLSDFLKLSTNTTLIYGASVLGVEIRLWVAYRSVANIVEVSPIWEGPAGSVVPYLNPGKPAQALRLFNILLKMIHRPPRTPTSGIPHMTLTNSKPGELHWDNEQQCYHLIEKGQLITIPNIQSKCVESS